MFFAIKAGAPLPPEALAVILCERFGWTLEYVYALDMADVAMIMAVLDGQARATKGKS